MGMRTRLPSTHQSLQKELQRCDLCGWLPFVCVCARMPSHRMKTVRSCCQCSAQVSCLAWYVMALHSGLADHRPHHHWHDRVVGQLVARPECVGNMLLCEPEK